MTSIRVLVALGAFVFAALMVSTASIASETITYTYDALGRLVKVVGAGDVNSGQTTSTTYDSAGNRTNQTVSGVSGPPPSQLSIDNVSVTEGGQLTFTVTRTGTTSTVVNVTYRTADGTASAGSDFTEITPTTLTFTAGQTAKTIVVSTIDDSVAEDVETMTVLLWDATGGSTITNATGTGTIHDNDIGLSIGDASVIEGGPLTFTVTRVGVLTGSVSASYATSDDTAFAGSDYTAVVSGTVTFAPNQTTQTITVNTLDDSDPEPSETMTVTLSSPTSGATLMLPTGTGTILDNDQPVALSVSDASATEGTSLAFTVTLSGPSGATVSVNYATGDSSATAVGNDYTPVSGTLTFAPSETTKTVFVHTLADSMSEPNETMVLNLSSASGATIANGVGTGTIVNGGSPEAIFSISDVTVTEGGTLSFTVTKSGFSFRTFKVPYTTMDGTAVAGSDYTAKSGELSFPFFLSSQTVTVATIQDNVEEATETMTVVLGAPNFEEGGLAKNIGVGTILDDDAPPPPSFAIAPTSATEGGTLSFVVTRSGTTSSAVSVDYATSDVSAVAGADYIAASGSLNFGAGETSKIVDVSTIDDSVYEGVETFQVTLTNPIGATISSGSAVGAINDNDAAPPGELSVSDATANEGSNLSFAVSLAPSSSATVTVSYATANGTATAGSDYTAASGTLTFNPGETSKTVAVATLTDSVAEAAETMTLNLSSPSSATIADGSGTGTIINVPTVTFSINDLDVSERLNPNEKLIFEVTKTGSHTGNITVNWTTANGTAIAGSDYVAESGTLTFGPLKMRDEIFITKINDNIKEAEEYMMVVMTSPTGNSGFTKDTGVGTIRDDD